MTDSAFVILLKLYRGMVSIETKGVSRIQFVVRGLCDVDSSKALNQADPD